MLKSFHLPGSAVQRVSSSHAAIVPTVASAHRNICSSAADVHARERCSASLRCSSTPSFAYMPHLRWSIRTAIAARKLSSMQEAPDAHLAGDVLSRHRASLRQALSFRSCAISITQFGEIFRGAKFFEQINFLRCESAHLNFCFGGTCCQPLLTPRYNSVIRCISIKRKICENFF